MANALFFLSSTIGKNKFAKFIDLKFEHVCDIEWSLSRRQLALDFVQANQVAFVYKLDMVHKAALPAVDQ